MITSYKELWTNEGLRKFFQLMKSRARIEINHARIRIWVPRKNYHFIRWFLLASPMGAPMGMLVEVGNLGFFENRFNKITIMENLQ